MSCTSPFFIEVRKNIRAECALTNLSRVKNANANLSGGAHWIFSHSPLNPCCVVFFFLILARTHPNPQSLHGKQEYISRRSEQLHIPVWERNKIQAISNTYLKVHEKPLKASLGYMSPKYLLRAGRKLCLAFKYSFWTCRYGFTN